MSRTRRVLRLLLAVNMMAIGSLHLVHPAPFVQMMPPYLPLHLELVYLSGVCEVLGGLGLLIPRVQRQAAWGLVALYIAVFPANLHMALNEVRVEGIPFNPTAYWLRLPLQAGFIAWAGWLTREERPAESGTEKAAVKGRG